LRSETSGVKALEKNILKQKGLGRVAQVVKQLPMKYKTLISNISIIKKKSCMQNIPKTLKNNN
jgi:hypothetical protein